MKVSHSFIWRRLFNVSHSFIWRRLLNVSHPFSHFSFHHILNNALTSRARCPLSFSFCRNTNCSDFSSIMFTFGARTAIVSANTSQPKVTIAASMSIYTSRSLFTLTPLSKCGTYFLMNEFTIVFSSTCSKFFILMTFICVIYSRELSLINRRSLNGLLFLLKYLMFLIIFFIATLIFSICKFSWKIFSFSSIFCLSASQ